MPFDIDDIVNVSGAEVAIDKVASKLGELDKIIDNLNKKSVTLSGISSIGELQKAVQELSQAEKKIGETLAEVSKIQTKSAGTTKGVTDAYSALRRETAEAERSLKNAVTIFGSGSQEALKAANNLSLLKARLNEVNAAAKGLTSVSPVVGVQSDDNLASGQAENQRAIEATGDALSDLEKAQAEAANTAVAFGKAQQEASEAVKATGINVDAAKTPFQEYTGTLQQNISLGLQYKQRLAEISSELKSGKGDTAALVTEQAELKSALAETTRVIDSQIKFLNAAEGSYDQLSARLGILQTLYRQLSEQEKASPLGSKLSAQIKLLNTELKGQEAQLGSSSRRIVDYRGEIISASNSTQLFSGNLGKAFSSLKRIADILPGLGISGIVLLGYEAVVKLAGSLLDLEDAEKKAERAAANLNNTLERQKTTLNENVEAIKQNTQEALAELARIGGSAKEVNDVIQQGLLDQQNEFRKTGEQNLEQFNQYARDLKKPFDLIRKNAEAIGVEVTLNPFEKLNLNLQPQDIQNLETVRKTLKALEDFKVSKDFDKTFTDAQKKSFEGLTTILKTAETSAKSVQDTFNQRFQANVDFIAKQAQELREANKFAAENEIKSQADAIERNQKADIQIASFSINIRKRSFEALKEQIDKEAKYQLNAEKVKVNRINQLRALELSQPGLSEAQRIRINSEADAQISAAKLTAKQRQAILAQQRDKELALEEEFALRKARATTQRLNAQRQYESEQLELITADLENSLSDRLAALKKFSEKQQEIIEQDAELQRKTDSYTSLTSEEQAQFDAGVQNKTLRLSIDVQKRITENLKLEINKRKELQEESVDDLERIYSRVDLSNSKQYTTDVIALNDSLIKKKISLDKYNNERSKLDKQAALDGLQITEQQLTKEIRIFKDSNQILLTEEIELNRLRAKFALATDDTQKNVIGGQIVAQKQRVANAKVATDQLIGLEKQLTDNQLAQSEIRKNDAETEAEKKRKIVQLTIDLAGIAANTIADFAAIGHNKRLEQIDEEQEALEERYAREVELINQSALSQADKDKELAKLAKRKEEQDKALRERERAERRRQAQIEKELAIFSIILNTAQAIAAALGNPFKIAIAAALGAAQLAVAISTPLPRFYKGKNIEGRDDYEGYAWVDDGGKAELIERADGRLEVGTRQPRITYVGKDDKVFPDAKAELIRRTMVNSQRGAIPITYVKGESYNELRSDIMLSSRNIVKAIKSQRPTSNPQIDYMRNWISSGESSESFYRRMTRR